jgi:hypothetical protein
MHVKESLETIRFDAPAIGYFAGDMESDTVDGVLANLGPARHEFLLKGRYFDLQRTRLEPGHQFKPLRGVDAPTVLMFLRGAGTLNGQAVSAGQTVLLPADLGAQSGVFAATGSEPLVWIESTPTPEA